MYKYLIITLFLFLFGMLKSQELQQYQFNIQRLNDSLRIESCIPMELYHDRMILPNQDIQKKAALNGTPMTVVGSKWINNCLMIQWPNIPNNDIIDYILEFTKLREDQIIIIE